MNEIGKTKTPNAGEWWVRNDDGAIVFICGCDQDGDPVWIDDEEELHNAMLRFFTKEYHHEPRCTGSDWVEPPAEVWPKYYRGENWSDADAYVRFDNATDQCVSVSAYGSTETHDETYAYVPYAIRRHSWRGITEAEALARVRHPTMDCPDCGEFRGHAHVCKKTVCAMCERPAIPGTGGCTECTEYATGATRCPVDPDDMPLNPIPGTVVATGTVKLTPVTPDDWVEFDVAQITCPRVSVDWLTPRLGENQWGPALAVWSYATWATGSENWKIRCLRRDLPIKPAEVSDMAAIIAEHTQQVRELTQRIGDLVQQVNERDAVIEQIRTALRQEYSV